MRSSLLLPAGLLVFLYVLPALSALTTLNDPLHGIAKLAPKLPEPPVCCLNPSSSQELSEELLSFEDWKARQSSSQTEGKAPQHLPSHHGSTIESSQEASADPYAVQQLVPDPPSPPHFRVPLTDRFNYASLDCSARVHAAHKESQSPKSILASQKDKYMLTPCNTSPKFVVVELCDDIRIDTVQLANFEFFSGVFQNFNVSVASTYTTETDGWTHVGTYKAKNIRGVQSFHPPTSLRDFYRFIRIDFLSHYGNEFYCPVSLLRVYGLTHLEEWKWDQWEAEGRAKRSDVEEVPVVSYIQEQSTQSIPAKKALKDAITVISPSKPSVPLVPSDADLLPSDDTNSSNVVMTTSNAMPVSATMRAESSDPIADSFQPSVVESEGPSIVSTFSTQTGFPLPSEGVSSSISHDLNASNAPTSLSLSQTDPDASTSTISVSIRSVTTSTGSSVPIVVASAPVAVPTVSSSAGESIYRTIMTRLSFLETNSTLYARYVEEQMRSVKDAIRRLEEDVGRLQGLAKAQSQTHQRTMQGWERQRNRLDREYAELLSKVNTLADEVTLEKRLGIAQLCLLLIVLIFMALTRGSRLELLHHKMSGSSRRTSLREWGRRNLSFSKDWVTRFRSRSPTPTPSKRPSVVSPAKKSQEQAKFPGSQLSVQTSPLQLKASLPELKAASSIPFPRTPLSRHRPATPTSFLYPRIRSSNSTPRPPIRRANSQNTPTVTIGPVPKSAMRWAKTAHLHEITNRKTPKSAPAREKVDDDTRNASYAQSRSGSEELLFWPAMPPTSDRSEGDEPSRIRKITMPLSALPEGSVRVEEPPDSFERAWNTTTVRTADDADADADADAWVDTDVEESDKESNR